MSIEAMKMALEALEVRCGTNADERKPGGVIEALRTAIQQAEAQQPATTEPVAWMHWLHGPVRVLMNKDEATMELERLNREYPSGADDRKMRPLVFGDTQPGHGVPEGYTLVPVEPTVEMLQAALKVATPGALCAAWARMLAASPAQK